VELAESGSEALLKTGTLSFQTALVNLMLPDMKGLEVLTEIKKLQPHCQVIIMTGHASIPTVVRSIRMGAFDFIKKPFSIADIRLVLKRAVQAAGIFSSNSLLEEAFAVTRRVGFVVYSREMQDLLVNAYKFAGKNLNVLIYGETGTGKELLASFIHAASDRAARTFLPVNCSALAENIVESELFGHEKGAFTGAERRRHGCFELANGGTIFLDEVGDASPGLQAKLLRVLETREFQRVGGEEIVRVVAATNIDLEHALHTKRFRDDLYYRLAAVRLDIPPLRCRREDILPLAEHMLRRFSNCGSGDVPSISPEAAKIMMDFSWPGNIRELANIVHQATALADGGIILPEHLPARLTRYEQQHSGFECISLSDDVCPPSLKELEKTAIIAALRYCQGNIKAAASVLGIGRATIHRKIKEHDIDLIRSVC